MDLVITNHATKRILDYYDKDFQAALDKIFTEIPGYMEGQEYFIVSDGGEEEYHFFTGDGRSLVCKKDGSDDKFYLVTVGSYTDYVDNSKVRKLDDEVTPFLKYSALEYLVKNAENVDDRLLLD